jgi:hypothetical protein
MTDCDRGRNLGETDAGIVLNECFRRVHAMGDAHRRADFVGGRK